MSIRDTDEYKNMNTYDACAIAEGFSETEPTQEQTAAAWQYIYDNQMYTWLQGWYGRVIFNDLIPAGMIEV